MEKLEWRVDLTQVSQSLQILVNAPSKISATHTGIPAVSQPGGILYIVFKENRKAEQLISGPRFFQVWGIAVTVETSM